ncbi:MAG: hypothetical protein ACRD6N_12050, partial [Pyrinomonadaceae bacterium]
MKTKLNITRLALFVVGATALCLLSPPVALVASPLWQAPAKIAPPKLTENQEQMIAAFNRHVKDYLEQRRAVAKKLPKLSKEATPQQIET